MLLVSATTLLDGTKKHSGWNHCGTNPSKCGLWTYLGQVGFKSVVRFEKERDWGRVMRAGAYFPSLRMSLSIFFLHPLQLARLDLLYSMTKSGGQGDEESNTTRGHAAECFPIVGSREG